MVASRPAPTDSAAAELVEQPQGNPLRKYSPQQAPGGALRGRPPPLDAWTKLAHALFQTNEAVMVN